MEENDFKMRPYKIQRKRERISTVVQRLISHFEMLHLHLAYRSFYLVSKCSVYAKESMNLKKSIIQLPPLVRKVKHT